jgi:hypothetical protein
MKAALFFALSLLLPATASEVAPGFPLHALTAQAWTSAETRASLLQLLNAERAAHGLGPLREQPQLRQAAQSHADYLAEHHQASHEQRPGQASFSGQRPWQRAEAAGYPLISRKQISELYVVGLHQADAALAQLLSGPYHRHALLAPKAVEVGIGLSAQPGLVLSLAHGDTAPPSSPWLIWPRPEQTVAPAACCERPRPAGLEEFGMPVSVQALSGEPLRVQRFELLDAQERAVATQLLHANTDAHLKQAPQVAYLLPLQPLKAGARYRVRLLAQAGSERIERDWFFDTTP